MASFMHSQPGAYIKIWFCSLKEVQSYGSLNLGSTFPPPIFNAPSGEIVCLMRTRFADGRVIGPTDLLDHNAKSGIGLVFRVPLGNEKFDRIQSCIVKIQDAILKIASCTNLVTFEISELQCSDKFFSL